MGRIKFNIHFTFVIFACILIFFGQGILLANYILTILLHELAHAMVARSLGYNIRSFVLMPFGISLSLNTSKMPPKDEIKVAMAGPGFNFSCVLFLLALWWLVPASFNFTYLFCYANLVEGLFNLLPAFPLDGGRIFRAIITEYFGIKRAVRACLVVNIVLITILGIMFVLSLFIGVNFTYLFVIVCILPLSNKSDAQSYAFIDYSLSKKNKKILKIKDLYVQSNERLYSVCKYIDAFTYINLYVYDENGVLIKIFGEREFVSFLNSCPSTFTFKELCSEHVIKK